MKRTLPIIIIAAQILLISGCKKDDKATSNQGIYQEMSQKVNELPEEFAFPDGTVVPKDDIDIKFSTPGSPYLDFAFIRYAEPIFVSTFGDPDIVAPETFEIKGDIQRSIEPQWIRVRAGDVLENGLRVVSAKTPCRSSTNEDGSTVVQLGSGEIKTEGEMTFEGILQYYNGSEYYGYGDYYLNFYPDSTKYRIPIIYNDSPSECAELQVRSLNISRNMALAYDGGYFYYFRFESEYYHDENNFKDMFNEDAVCKAKMSFKDIVICGRYSLDGVITAIEPET